MTRLVFHLKQRMIRFHRNESGMETLQVILIIALAAIVGVALYQFGGLAVQFLKDCTHGFRGSKDGYDTGGKG